MLTIVTHDGKFHADEVTAIALLAIALDPPGRGSFGFRLIRSRDRDVIESGDVVIDVGGVYDVTKQRFDHHQREGAGVRSNGVPYASAGLVLRGYGSQAVKWRLRNSLRKPLAEEIWRIVDELDAEIIQYIDGVDCGHRAEGYGTGPRSFNLSGTVSLFNPPAGVGSDAAFEDAVRFMKRIIENFIDAAYNRICSEKYVEEEIKSQYPSRILTLTQQVPWREVVANHSHIMLVVQDAGDRWNILTVSGEDKTNRLSLPQEWGGLSGKELVKVTGVETAIFCHRGLFIAGAKLCHDAIDMAEISLALAENKEKSDV